MQAQETFEARLARHYAANRQRMMRPANAVKQPASAKPVLILDQHDHHVREWQWRRAAWEATQEAAKGSRCRAYIKQRCEELGFAYADMIGQSRVYALAAARQLLMWEIKTKVKPDATLPEIGRMFGGRDHTTVHHALRKHGYEPGASSRMTDEKIALMKQLREEGVSFDGVARKVGCSPDTVRIYTVEGYRDRMKERKRRQNG